MHYGSLLSLFFVLPNPSQFPPPSRHQLLPMGPFNQLTCSHSENTKVFVPHHLQAPTSLPPFAPSPRVRRKEARRKEKTDISGVKLDQNYHFCLRSHPHSYFLSIMCPPFLPFIPPYSRLYPSKRSLHGVWVFRFGVFFYDACSGFLLSTGLVFPPGDLGNIILLYIIPFAFFGSRCFILFGVFFPFFSVFFSFFHGRFGRKVGFYSCRGRLGMDGLFLVVCPVLFYSILLIYDTFCFHFIGYYIATITEENL